MHHRPHAPHATPADGAQLVTCPVCHMDMEPADAASTLDHEGVTYHFCAVPCERAFAREPAKYVSKQEPRDTAAAGDALTLVPYPAFVVGTTNEAGSPHFMLANWGTQASFEPWRFVVALTNTARTLAYAKRGQAFTVNLLDSNQKNTPRAIVRAKGADQPFTPGATKAPRLAASFAGFDCVLTDVLEIGGDHVLLVGEVVSGWKTQDATALGLADAGMRYAG